MISALLLAVALSGLPATSPMGTPFATGSLPAEVKSPLPTIRPALIPGYPDRVLTRTQYRGAVYQVWGWVDTERVVHWFPSENPHIPYTLDAPAVLNYGINVGELHRNTIGGTLRTNDPAFSEAWTGVRLNIHPDHAIDGPCPGPGPCPYPNPRPNPAPDPAPNPSPPPTPPNPDLQRWIIPGAMAVMAVAIVLFAVSRKAADA